MKKMNIHIRNLVYSALCLSLCISLPFLTGQIQSFGQLLSPMHLPVLLCGLISTWYWGAAVGFIAPLLRCLLFGMPMIIKAVPMAFELAAYELLPVSSLSCCRKSFLIYVTYIFLL